MGLMVHQATDLDFLVPESLPRTYLGSGCSASQHALEQLKNTDVVLVPTRLGEVDTAACDHTIGLLAARGYFWLPYVNRAWVCERFAQYGNDWLNANAIAGKEGAIPMVAVDGQVHLGASQELLSTLATRYPGH